MGAMSDLDLHTPDLEWPLLKCSSSVSIFSHDLGEQLLPTSPLFRGAITVDLLFPFGTCDLPIHSVSILLTHLSLFLTSPLGSLNITAQVL